MGSEMCIRDSVYEVFGPKWHPEFHGIFFFGIRFMEMQLFETCTTYLVQNGIPNSTKRGPKPHFVVRGGPIRAQPARPASLAASAGRWAWPAGGPRWQPMGQLAAISRCSSWQWVRAEVEREEAGQTTAPPPHSYHRRWVIWYMKSKRKA